MVNSGNLRSKRLRSSYLCLLALVCLGCGPRGPGSHQVSGQVTYAGKPVPVGRVKFLPATASGNKGPASLAIIKDGTYSTPSNKLLGDGDYDVEVVGFDGVPTEMEGEELRDGVPLFPAYNVKVLISANSLKHDFEIPKNEAE